MELGALEIMFKIDGWKVFPGLWYQCSPGELSTHRAARVQYVPGNT